MNEKEIAHALGSMKEADAPLHQASLRYALLSRAKRKAVPLQTFITIFAMKKYSIPLSVLGVVALALVFNVTSIDPSTAQAQELAQQAYVRAISISPEMRAQFEAQMKTDMLDALKEARAAKDLRILTPEQYAKEAMFTISTTSPSWNSFDYSVPQNIQSGEVKTIKINRDDAAYATEPGEGVSFTVSGTLATGSAGEKIEMKPLPQPVKYLSYTDPRGNKVVLGLDKDDTPVFRIMSLQMSDIIPLDNGVIGVPAQAFKIINIEHKQ